MEINELDWDDQNIAKLAAHGVPYGEADSVIRVDAWMAKVHEGYPDQVRITGPASTGRFVTLALEPTDELAVWHPVTGWPAPSEEIAYHREEYR